MLRVPLGKAHMKRTLGVLYGWVQTTPKSMFLDPEWDRSVPIYPGMVAMKTTGEQVTLANETGDPEGLFGLYIGGDGIDELEEIGINACAVWVLGPDAEFYVEAPAFDADLPWAEVGDGTATLVHYVTTGDTRGKLCLADSANASAQPVARLLKVESDSRIIIGGLRAQDAAPAAPAGTP